MLHCKLLVWCIFTATLCGAQFNKYIKHFEPLTYNSEEIHDHHLRHKRSINSNPFVNIKFHAHGRHFHLRLRRDISICKSIRPMEFFISLIHHIFTKEHYGDEFRKKCEKPNLVSEFVNKGIFRDVFKICTEKDQNKLINDVKTVFLKPGDIPTLLIAFGSIRNGVFDGNVHTEKGTYYVERANKYFADDMAPGFHSLIYHERDIKDNHPGFGGCGVTDDVLKWMHNISNSAVEENNTMNDSKSSKPREKKAKTNYYSKDHQEHHAFGSEGHSRAKRAVPKQRACSLYIQTDTLLWDHIHNQEKDPMKAREEITSLIAQHVKAVNHIYQNANFTLYQGIKFVVQRITINDSSACNTSKKVQTNPFCSHNIDVSNFLNLNSQMRHDAFCLAYVFTYRDFSGGTLGLAWVASPQGASGGICEQYKSYSENVGGRPIQTKRSLNTGIITFVNYNTRVPPKVSQLTLAHEIGHNFGSPHDYPTDCKPGGAEGNYIMFASATSGDRPNNVRFSHCSVGNISAVLHALFSHSSGKRLCLQEDRGAFCGNKIVEENEQCDCGYDEVECNDQCCYPRDSGPNNTNQCTHRPRAQCSPSEGPCCNELCQFEKPKKLCRHESECKRCVRLLSINQIIQRNAMKGQEYALEECVGSICLKHGKEECFLPKSVGVTPEKLCELACQNDGAPDTCASHMDSSYNNIKLRPGAPCDNFQGYCDVFQKCRAVDAEGPLARLKNLLFSPYTLTSVAEWVTVNWWAVLLSGVSFIIVMGVFIKCCAVHTPSSNPKKPPARRISDTLRRPAQTLRRKRHRHHQTAPQHSQAPPPYPGRPGTSQGGPAHGYGEGRGHYNRPKNGQTSWTADDPYAAAYPGRNLFEMRQHKFIMIWCHTLFKDVLKDT
uniref:ADAM10 endopeptidase n=1 Tax=Strigamia maritima TaxID=126957 RepID=T1J2R6_STRMM